MNDSSGVNFIAVMISDLRGLLRDGPRNYKPKWRGMYLVWGESTHRPLSSSTHIQDIHRLFDAAGITCKTAITHVFRHTKTCELLEAAVPALSTKLFGRWSDASAMESYEATSYKMDAMLAAGGWKGPDSYYCWWESPSVTPPLGAGSPSVTNPKDSLFTSVFMGLDTATELANRAMDTFGQDADISALAFCKVLRYLQKVFLEDAVVLYDDHKTFPAYQHKVLTTHEFKTYAKAELVNIESRKVAMSQDTEITEKLKQVNDKLHNFEELLLHAVANNVVTNVPSVATSSGASAFNVRHTTDVNTPKTVIIPEPPETISDMRSYYSSWCGSIRSMYQEHKRVHKGFKWSLVSANPKLAAQRFSYIKTFLEFMDSQSAPDTVLGILETFAKDHNVNHSVLIKKLFNKMIKGVCVGNEYNVLSDLLYTSLVKAGLTVPTKVKQDHSFRKRGPQF
ncbi:hypothetical protein EBZ39_06895 [bacterium]|nr:hypothetical protein [bacterium]